MLTGDAGGTTIETTTKRPRARRTLAALAIVAAAAAFGASAASAAAPLTWSGPTTADSSGTHVSALSCPAVGLCVAADYGGAITYTTTPATGGWSAPLTIDAGHQLDAISCPSTSLCFAVDDHGGVLSSATPASTAAWTPQTIDGTTQLNGISCPSTALCVAVDNAGAVLTSTTPGSAAAWSTQTIDSSNHLTAVSCPTTTFCAAVDNAGRVFVTSTPTGTWQAPLTLSGTAALNGVSCISSGLCVVVASDGTVYASGNANAAAPTWSTTQADANPLAAVSCSDVGVCVLGDQSGSVLASDTPALSPPSWASEAIDAGHSLSAVACLSGGLCVALDTAGQAFAATLAAPAVTTGTATVASQTTATVNATVNPNDATLSDCHFDYGTTTAYGASAPCAVVPSATGGSQAVTATLTGLSAGTTYHYRIVAASAVAASDGADATFVTTQPIKPHPSIGGTPAVGNTLTCYPNATTTAAVTVAFQWLSDTAPIPGANAATYVVAPTDAGHHLSCQVTIAGDGGSATATSGFKGVPSQTQQQIVETTVGIERRFATSVLVPVTCSPQASPSCKIKVALSVVRTVRHKRKTVGVGSTTVVIGSGVTRKVRVSLNKTGMRLLRSQRRLTVKLTVHGTVLGVLTATLQTRKLTFGPLHKHATRRRAHRGKTSKRKRPAHHAPRR